jgi:DNA-binding CsgD family transcriptional regulator
MYVNTVFILYIIAMLISIVCLVFAALVFVHKTERENRTYIAARRFAIVVLLTDLLYFIFYYREVVQQKFALALPFRIADYALCSLLVLCWIMLLLHLLDREKHRRLAAAGIAVTALRIFASIVVTTAFMGAYYDISSPAVRAAWTAAETVFITITAVMIIYGSICGIIESVSTFRKRFIVVCSALIILWNVIQGVVDFGLFAGNYGVSAWELQTPDFTGAVMFLLNLATCVFVFTEDFSPLFFNSRRAYEAADSSADSTALPAAAESSFRTTAAGSATHNALNPDTAAGQTAAGSTAHTVLNPAAHTASNRDAAAAAESASHAALKPSAALLNPDAAAVGPDIPLSTAGSDISPSTAGETMSRGQNMQLDEKLDILAEIHRLTVREREVLGHIYMGKTNPEIAAELYISVNTVKKHIKNIYDKMGINSRMEVVHVVDSWRA